MLYQRDFPSLPCNDLFKCLRLIILPHSADIISFTAQSLPADVLLDPLRSALNEAPLELQRPAVSLTHPAYKAGALTDELPPSNI